MAGYMKLKSETAEQRWMQKHKKIFVENDVHEELVKHAGRLQVERGKMVSISEAIKDALTRIVALEAT